MSLISSLSNHTGSERDRRLRDALQLALVQHEAESRVVARSLARMTHFRRQAEDFAVQLESAIHASTHAALARHDEAVLAALVPLHPTNQP